MSIVPIIIPAYEPDERLIALLNDLVAKQSQPIILVNDGSSDAHNEIFNRVEDILKSAHGVLLVHNENKGKGRALKTAFSYVLEHYPEAIGSVTADSDGQHTVECIQSVTEELIRFPKELILGVRNFDGDDVPWKSRFGNKLTAKVLGYSSGLHISDTQTGLRGIPREFMKTLLDVEGERFEFETRMLLESVGRCKIREVTVKTIYDSKENHQTHFNPVVDSIKIYKILGVQFLKYIAASLSSSVVDVLLFTLFCVLLRNRISLYIAFATIFARIISATYNYIINYKVVFKSRENVAKAAVKYVVLAVSQMLLSAVLVSMGVYILAFVPEVLIKIVVDTILFFASYYIQQKYVFH